MNIWQWIGIMMGIGICILLACVIAGSVANQKMKYMFKKEEKKRLGKILKRCRGCDYSTGSVITRCIRCDRYYGNITGLKDLYAKKKEKK